MSCKLKFIDSARFMVSSLSKIKYKCEHENNKCKTCGIKFKGCKCCLGYKNVKDHLIVFKCRNRNCQSKLDENLKR